MFGRSVILLSEFIQIFRGSILGLLPQKASFRGVPRFSRLRQNLRNLFQRHPSRFESDDPDRFSALGDRHVLLHPIAQHRACRGLTYH